MAVCLHCLGYCCLWIDCLVDCANEIDDQNGDESENDGANDSFRRILPSPNSKQLPMSKKDSPQGSLPQSCNCDAGTDQAKDRGTFVIKKRTASE